MEKKNWIIKVFVLTFIMSIVFSYITNIVSMKTNIIINGIIIITVIAIGILFDMIGTSALTAKEATFHAMASKKIKGASSAVKLIRNKIKVSSICNDIIGDICGIISGGLGAVLAIGIANYFHINIALITIIISATISSLTVGGKAYFKRIAIKNCDQILFNFSKIISIFIKTK